MPVLHWQDPTTREEWKILYPLSFQGDILFTCIHSKTNYTEAYSICAYIYKLVKDDYLRPAKVRRKEVALAARDIKGKPCVLHIPFELLMEVVAKGYVFHKLFRWFYSMETEVLLGFLPLADTRKDRYPSKKIAECLYGLKLSIYRTRNKKQEGKQARKQASKQRSKQEAKKSRKEEEDG